MHEQEVLALLRAGDERGAEALLRHYAPLMRYIIAPIVPDAQDREECLSDAALRVWEKFGTYDPARGSWTAWLTALTRNTALNRARKKSGGSEELSGDLPSAEPTPEERLMQQERRQALERFRVGERFAVFPAGHRLPRHEKLFRELLLRQVFPVPKLQYHIFCFHIPITSWGKYTRSLRRRQATRCCLCALYLLR